jgi:hypothetical protein
VQPSRVEIRRAPPRERLEGPPDDGGLLMEAIYQYPVTTAYVFIATYIILALEILTRVR